MRTGFRPSVGLALAALVLACPSCSSKPAEAPGERSESSSPPSNAPTVVVGYTASASGKLNVESIRQRNGLELWREHVNATGAWRVETRWYDDESRSDRIQELYTRLATNDHANFLISPYSSGLTAAAAVISEQYGIPMISTGAASDSTYQQGLTMVYQVYTPASQYLTGALDLLAARLPDLKKLAILHEADRFSSDVAAAVKARAEASGYAVVLDEGYDSATTDFSPFINKIQQARPDAVVGGGHFQDGSALARQLADKRVAVPFVALLVAPPEPSFAELGSAAIGIVGPSQWEPQAAYDAAAAQAAGTRWVGPTGAEFAHAYLQAFGEQPSYHAAGGYAAGLVLQDALQRAGSGEATALKTALDATDIMTFFGRTTFATAPESHGLQVGHLMVYVQWQQGAGGKPVKRVVWPAAAASAELAARPTP
ncbi:MAG: amino acid ABC transporter substrate-binding protein [Candidatus Schekmanbacteria bacterium]|nr:amino acid ABC transporter substrate-binding protein [Candidatus Schekmanbacteria bacterium]